MKLPTPFVCINIEAGTLLEPFVRLYYPVAITVGTEVAVTADFRNGVILLQDTNQGTQGVLLLLGAGVGGLSAGIQTAFVGYTNAVLIVSFGMGSYPLDGPGAPDITVLADVEVIAYHRHASSPMTTQQVLLGEVGVGTGSGAVDNERGYPTQAVMPSAPAMPEAIPMMILKMISHVLLLLVSIFFSYNYE